MNPQERDEMSVWYERLDRPRFPFLGVVEAVLWLCILAVLVMSLAYLWGF